SHHCLNAHLGLLIPKFEASAEPLQDWLSNTEVKVQESSTRLHDLSAKREELSKLQVIWAAC
uniref:Uncharacterized protein n=1 Tax=Periophthalmus magnuspinnatus TaxID=409849 RepID=A0A3B4B574_9GOBI